MEKMTGGKSEEKDLVGPRELEQLGSVGSRVLNDVRTNSLQTLAASPELSAAIGRSGPGALDRKQSALHVGNTIGAGE
jgi:hypothetical protein